MAANDNWRAANDNHRRAANDNHRRAANDNRLVFPNDRQRITIIGKTGSGKTQAAAWLLSQRSYTTRPWVIIDYKLEDLLNDIPGVEEISPSGKLPKHPGLYITHPNPADEDDIEKLFWQAWSREGVGLYIDEGYMIPLRSQAFQAILTQGRSKSIPVIMLTQRPAWVTRFAFSEADYIQLFQLTDSRDRKIVKQFMPLPIETELPQKYYSWFWDNSRNFKAVLQPVPSRDNILENFHRRLIKPRRIL